MSDNIGKVFNLGAGGGQGDLTLEAADERYLQKSGGSIEARSAFVLEHIQEYADIPSVRLSINAQEELVEGAPFVARVSKDDNFVSELNLYESGVHLHSGAMPDCRSRISVYDPMTITDGVSDIIVMEVEQYNTRTGIYIRHGEVALQIGDSDLDYPSSYFSFNPDHITWTSPDRPPVCITCFDTGYDGLKVSINGDNIVTESEVCNRWLSLDGEAEMYGPLRFESTDEFEVEIGKSGTYYDAPGHEVGSNCNILFIHAAMLGIDCDTSLNGHYLQNIASPTKAADAANKNYVDVAVFGAKIPPGVIVMWSGAVNNIPSGWVLCNGANGTPNLINRFVMGAGTRYAVGATGGEEKHTLTDNELPQHSHSIITALYEVTDGKYEGLLSVQTDVRFPNKTGALGSAYPHNNLPPYYALCYIMKT